MADVTARFVQLKAISPMLVGQGWETRIAAAANGVIYQSIRGAAYTVLGSGLASATLTDANATVLATTASEYTLPAASPPLIVGLTANRSLTLSPTGAVTGEVIRVIRLDATAFTYAIINGGPGAGTLITLPASAGRLADFFFDGTNWSLSGVVRLAP